eukprot:TRINITY_DN8073_c0_g1_i1.p1 TRINITY_DN8073_c0_g1~~TRINITY_DN8073_c0_g1_i1.p1  ORF type:complete len:123 (+),score=10.10 TRINITY_DN8073_c0_g1_i1:248-616(+)
MSLSPTTLPYSTLKHPSNLRLNCVLTTRRIQNLRSIISCESTRSSEGSSSLHIGSPIIVVEAPATLKTADSMPSLKVNSGFVKPGDVGRIVARKPKDVWAVRLTIGTFLMDGKYFKPLDLDE